jgi:hypothetical protein
VVVLLSFALVYHREVAEDPDAGREDVIVPQRAGGGASVVSVLALTAQDLHERLRRQDERVRQSGPGTPTPGATRFHCSSARTRPLLPGTHRSPAARGSGRRGPSGSLRASRRGKAPDAARHCPVTRLDCPDGWLVPIAFVATTPKRYDPTAGSVIEYDRADADSRGEDVVPRTLPARSYRIAVTV